MAAPAQEPAGAAAVEGAEAAELWGFWPCSAEVGASHRIAASLPPMELKNADRSLRQNQAPQRLPGNKSFNTQQLGIVEMILFQAFSGDEVTLRRRPASRLQRKPPSTLLAKVRWVSIEAGSESGICNRPRSLDPAAYDSSLKTNNRKSILTVTIQNSNINQGFFKS